MFHMVTHSLLVANHTEQIAFRRILHNHKDPITFFQHSAHTDDRWMASRETVKTYFSPLELSLSGIETIPTQTLDRAR